MIPFAESSVCSGRRRCHICRDPSAEGQKWRGAVVAHFIWDGSSCPIGLTIGGLVPESISPAPPTRPAPTAEQQASAAQRREENTLIQDCPFKPGDRLHDIFARIGITPSAGCQCNARQRQMNLWAAELYRDNPGADVRRLFIDRYGDEVAGWLYSEAKVVPRAIIKGAISLVL